MAVVGALLAPAACHTHGYTQDALTGMKHPPAPNDPDDLNDLNDLRDLKNFYRRNFCGFRNIR